MDRDPCESVRVAVVFSQGRARPVWFDLRGRQIWIKDVAFSWRTMQGRETIHHFSVTDGSGLYELRFNRESMLWTLLNSE